MKFGVVVFPGSNCDADCYHVARDVMGEECEYIWHQERKISGFDALIIPGGFSYGDYLRAGAIARFSPIMDEVRAFAENGGIVLGICNGFQILTEAGILPGVLLRNRSLKFLCHPVNLKVRRADTPFTSAYREGQVLTMPIAHGEGNYFCDQATLEDLEAYRQIVFTYCDINGEETEKANPNGALHNIAGIVNREGNVLGMMPHPERCAEMILGGEDGRGIFTSIVNLLKGGALR